MVESGLKGCKVVWRAESFVTDSAPGILGMVWNASADVVLERGYVVKETGHGVWISDSPNLREELVSRATSRWYSFHTKQWSRTKQDAVARLRHRKHSHLQHERRRLAEVEAQYNAADRAVKGKTGRVTVSDVVRIFSGVRRGRSWLRRRNGDQ